MEALKYWPLALGSLVMVGGAVAFWPQGSSEVTYAQTALVEQPLPYESDPEADAERPSEDSGTAAAQPSGQALRPVKLPEAEVRFIEHMTAVPREVEPAVTHTQDDPEVKQALKSVRIEMYEADWCGVCRRAREYFAHNQLSYTSYDVDQNAMAKEKARRLSGQQGVPVIVIDGKVTTGFSEGMIQAMLLSAVKDRVGGT